MAENLVIRICTRCSEPKPETNFGWSTGKKTRAGQCRDCRNEYKRQWEQKNLDRVRSRQRQWVADNPSKVEAASRKHLMEKRYGISCERYAEMLAVQKGVCAICNEVPDNHSLAVDHDHACCSGKTSCGSCVRGLLCRTCNSAIGFFRDDAAMLARAIQYIKGN